MNGAARQKRTDRVATGEFALTRFRFAFRLNHLLDLSVPVDLTWVDLTWDANISFLRNYQNYDKFSI